MSHWDFGAQQPGHNDPGWQHGADDDDPYTDDGTAPYPVTWERDQPGGDGYLQDPWGQSPDQTAVYPPRDGFDPWPRAPHPADAFRASPDEGGEWVTEQASPWAGDSSADRHGGAGPHQGAGPARGAGYTGDSGYPGIPGRMPEAGWANRTRPARPRWLVPAAVVVAGTLAGITTIVLTSNSGPSKPAAIPSTPSASAPVSSAPPAATAKPPLTLTQAQRVMAGYTTANNGANAQRSSALLGTVETGSSFAIDAGLYRVQRAAGAAPYPAFSPAKSVYYIPRTEPAGGPRWFAVQVSNAFIRNPGKVVSTEFVLFTQNTPGGPWRNTFEPYLVPGATVPQISVGPDGLASAVVPVTGALTVAPDQIAAVTAAALDGAPSGAGTVANPAGAAAGLADHLDQRFWRTRLPAAAITDAHAAAPGMPVFGLLTSDGGALLFYADTARLTLAPPAGSLLRLTVPGYYSPATALQQAALSYTDQLAAYDPPATAGGSPRVIATYSGITGKG
jgi:hypothetical protein